MLLHLTIRSVHLLKQPLQSQFFVPVLPKILVLALQSWYRSFLPYSLRNPMHRKSSMPRSSLLLLHPVSPSLNFPRSYQKELYFPVVHRQINVWYLHSSPPVSHLKPLNMLLLFPDGSNLRSNGSSLSFPLQKDQPTQRSRPD